MSVPSIDDAAAAARAAAQGVPGRDELAALTGGALQVPVAGLGWLRLTGADRVDFLHGQLSNEVRGLGTGSFNRSLLLNHRGHALADMRVLKGDDRLELVVEGGGLELVEESLRRHIVFDQVELTRPPERVAGLTLQGPTAEAVASAVLAQQLPAEGRYSTVSLAGGQAVIVRSTRSTAGGVDLYLQDGSLEALAAEFNAAGATPGSAAALRLARVCAGLATAADEGGEGVLPQEAGLESLVSYRKGCYLGQEIMARIEARGKLRRELGAVRLDRLPPVGERRLLRDGRPVGVLGTVAVHPESGVLALAVLRSDLGEDDALEVGGVQASRVTLPIG